MSFFSAIGSIGTALTGGAALIGALKGGGSEGSGVLKGQEQRLGFADQLARAIADPNSELFRNLVTQEEQAANQSFAQGLYRFFIEDARRRAAGGRGSVTNPERRDEAFASALAKQRETATAEARRRARETLQNAASATGIGLQTAPSTVTAAQNIGQTERDVFSAGVEGAGTILGSLESIFGQSQSQRPTTGSATGRSLPNIRIGGTT